MKPLESNDDFNPDLLAGYADGELDSSTRGRVDAYLATHPEVRSELELQRTLSRKSAFWSRLAPPSPSDSAWGRTLGGIRSELNPATPAGYRTPVAVPRSRWFRAALSVSGIAAAMMVAFVMMSNGPNNSTIQPLVSSDEVLPITLASEVDIFSIQGDDAVIVVGQPPLVGPMELISVGEYALDAIRTDPDGRDGKGTVIAGVKPVLLVPGGKSTANPTLPTP